MEEVDDIEVGDGGRKRVVYLVEGLARQVRYSQR